MDFYTTDGIYLEPSSFRRGVVVPTTNEEVAHVSGCRSLAGSGAEYVVLLAIRKCREE